MRVAVVFVCLVDVACSSGKSPKTAPTSSASAGPRYFGVEHYSGDPNGSGLCGEYSLIWKSPDISEGGAPATLTAISGRDIALDLEGRDEIEQLIASWCADVDSDGRIELGTERFSGGAHCCWSMRVDTLEGPTLLDRDLGNYGGLEPDDVDNGGALELSGRSDVLAYFGDVPYAASPSLPLVLALRDGRYVEATDDFPRHVRKSLKEAEADLREALANGDELAIKGTALGVYGHHVLLRDEESALDDLAGAVPDDVAQWLRDHAEAAVALIRGERTK